MAELDEERSRLVEKQAQIEAARSDLERRAAEEEEQRKKRTALRLDREIAVFRRQARQALASMRDDAERRRAERKAGAAERSLKASRARAVARDGAQEPSSKPEKLEVGLKVHVRSLGRQGTVRRVDGKRVELELGRIGVTVDADDLRLPGGEAAERPRRAARSRSVARDLETAPPLELMLVGQTVDEALDAIDRFLDDAVLGAIREVRLIHGHGTGRLRRGVREHLRRHPLVRDQRPGSESEGGDGATVVRLK